MSNQTKRLATIVATTALLFPVFLVGTPTFAKTNDHAFQRSIEALKQVALDYCENLRGDLYEELAYGTAASADKVRTEAKNAGCAWALR